MKKYILSIIVFTAALFAGLPVFAEGSGNWTGSQTSRQSNLWVPSYSTATNDVNMNYTTRGFMMLSSTRSGQTAYNNAYDPGHRFYVYVKAGETVYFSFRHASGSARAFNWYYDATTNGVNEKFPDGKTGSSRTLVTSVNSALTGNTSTNSNLTQTQANQGPRPLAGGNNGYQINSSNGGSFTNNTGADRAYWLEFTSANGFQISFWDVTVAQGSTRHEGRVYSKYWSMYTGLPTSSSVGTTNSSSLHDNFGFYVPVENTNTSGDDYYVKYVNFGRSNAGYAVFFANDSGPLNKTLPSSGLPDIEENRKSIKGTSNRFQYPLFVSEPDESIWASTTPPVANTDVRFRRKADATGGEAYFLVEVDTPGSLDILVDLDDSGDYSAGDVQIFEYFATAGQYEVYWDGKDGNGVVVPSGTPIKLLTSANFFPVHFPVYDMEQSLGVRMENVRPTATGQASVKLFWDHSNIYTGNKNNNSWNGSPDNSVQSPAINTTGVDGPDNIWWATGDNGIGNNNTMNVYAGSWMEILELEFSFDWDASDIEVIKTVNNSSPVFGSQVAFVIEVVNNGLMFAQDVKVKDLLPSGYAYIGHEAPMGKKVTIPELSSANTEETWEDYQTTYDPVTGEWDVKDIPYNIVDMSQNRLVLTIYAEVLNTGEYTNTAEGFPAVKDSDPNHTNNTSTVVVTPIDPPCVDEVIFFEDFGVSDKDDGYFGRKISPYMPHGSFIFGTPYPQSNINNETEIDNNHYAVVAPGYIKLGANPANSGWYFWTPAYNEDNTITDRSGTESGAVMAINAGSTLDAFYQREINVVSGKSYRASFWLYLVKGPSQVSIDIMNPATKEVLAVMTSPEMVDWDSNYKSKWTELDLYFTIPADLDCDIDELLLSFRNNKSEHFGNDYYVDDIKLEQVCEVPEDTPVVDVTCPTYTVSIDANDDINQTPQNVSALGNVLTNDEGEEIKVTGFTYLDSNGDKKTASVNATTTIYDENKVLAGTIIIQQDGSYTFNPAQGYTGKVPVVYDIKDRVDETDSATLTITVVPSVNPLENNPPVANNDNVKTKTGVTLNGNILSNDSDPDGDYIEVTGIKQGSELITVGGTTPIHVAGKNIYGNDVPDAGTIIINADGTFVFTPAEGFAGTINPIEYTIKDYESDKTTERGGSDTAILNITVEDIGADVNVTYANDDANTAPRGVTMEGNVLDNDFDPEDDDQTLTKITIDGTNYDVPQTENDDVEVIISGKGTLTIDKDGKYIFVPETEFVGTLVVEQTVCDNGIPVACDNATLYLTSLPESDNSTTAVDDFYETGNNTPITGNVMENDYDNEGDIQRVTTTGTIATTEGGTVIIDEYGNFTYTPPADKNGIFDTFTYTVCDDVTPAVCDVAEVIIAVGICYEEVGGKSFYWNYSSGSGVATETITQPVANYGFTFDIYELDNSFNMKINGVQLAVDEIEFQSNGTSGINIMFADGDKYEVDTQGAEGKAIWQMRGNAANPLIRVVISHTGKVTMYGSKVSYGPLFPLKFIEEKGNEFNPIDFSNAGGENNVIEVTQNRVGVTIMDGKGYGRNMVDCPNYWYGYNDSEWSKNSNWTDNYVPEAYEDIEFATEDNNRGIIQGMSGPGAGKGAAVKDLHLDNVNHNFKDTTTPSGGRIIGDLINKSEKDLVVTTTNQLIIDGKVHGDNTGIIVVTADKDDATGTLIFNKPNDNKNVAAKVEFYNKAFTCPDCGFYRKQWQYFGIPVDKSKFPYLSPQVETINEWMENVDGNKWVNRAANHELEAFRGYEINNSNTTKPTHIYDFSGILNVGNAVVALTKTSNVNYSGMNLIANSFTAAIPISEDAISYSDNSWDKMVYLFNAGTRDQWRKLNGGNIVHDTQSGQYKAVPLKVAGMAGLEDRIPSMHTFMVNAPSTGTMTIAYNELTKNGLVNGMAWRSANTNAKRELPYIVLDVIGEGSADRVWLFEESSTTRGYDNGWDGHKMLEGDLIQVFATDADHNKYQVTTVPQLDNTTLGIAARENESYTISVAVADDVEVRRLYLHDLFTGRGYLLKNGAEFVISGTRSANQNRFKITSSPIAEAQKGDDASIINTYVRDNVIVVENRSTENAIVSVYDISGRFVGKAQIAKDEIKSFAELSVGTGVKVVKVVSSSGSINRSDRVLLK